MSADLALQKAVRARLVATMEVTALVPAANILDRNARPAPDPSIVLGEGQALEGDRIDRSDQRLVLTLHVWKEPGLTGAKAIAGTIRAALKSVNLTNLTGYHFGDCHVTDTRYLRDPDGETAHAVVTVEAIFVEVAT